MEKYNPESTGLKTNGIFGLPYTQEQSQLVILPAPWDVTNSFGDGTSLCPSQIQALSSQIDLYDPWFQNAFEKGIFMQPENSKWVDENKHLRRLAKSIIESLEHNKPLDLQQRNDLKKINKTCSEFHEFNYLQSLELMKQGKAVGLLGGDHSTALGNIKAHIEYHGPDLGILQFDAHADLRIAYQGFQHSHASIMDNVLKLDQAPSKLIQVGIRDYCESEFLYTQQDDRIDTYFDHQIQDQLLAGTQWTQIEKDIAIELPKNVYISMDIDGLTPDLCPSTGTPVPGGVTYNQFAHLLKTLVNLGKNIVGFDLCEVSPQTEWDSIVGSRVLYKLCAATLACRSK